MPQRHDLGSGFSQFCAAAIWRWRLGVFGTNLVVWLLASVSPVLAQTVPTTEVPSPTLPTVNIDQLFQPIPPAPAIPTVAVPEVTNIVTPQVPSAVFPDFNFGTAPVNPPTVTSPPFSGPQFTAPQFAAPALAAPAFAAPNLAAPTFVGFQGAAPQFAGPTFNGPAFSPPNLAAPAFSAPTLNFVSASEADTSIESPAFPSVTLPEVVSPFGN